ncbi:MAG: RluA family pseudouridine synthase [Desulfococcaceae bacterium]
MTDDSHSFSLIADEQRAGQRLDVLIASHVSECSRSLAAALIRKGMIQVENETRKPGYRVQTGDRIWGSIPRPEPSVFRPEPIPIRVIYEDADIILIDKPSGFVVHPAAGHADGTLVNALLHHCPDIRGIGGEIRPGIVHRLDKDTSGILAVAKNAEAMASLAEQFQARTVRKKYLALIHGQPEKNSGNISLPVGRHPADRKKMSVISTKGRAAETLWQVRERFPETALLDIDLKTGRTHQIRVHCAAIGHPVVGDQVYGGRSPKRHSPEISVLLKSVSRQMLHAWQIRLIHPGTGEEMFFEAPVPEDMAQLITSLERSKEKHNGAY